MKCCFIGSKAEIEAAAERLDKEMNTDLESDCEAVISISKTNKQQPRQNSATSTTNLSKINTETGGPSTTKTNNTQKKNDNGNLLKTNFPLFPETSLSLLILHSQKYNP